MTHDAAGLNDTIKGLNPWDKETTVRGIVSKWAGAQFAVIMSGFVTYPFDTVRRRMQARARSRCARRRCGCLSAAVWVPGAAATCRVCPRCGLLGRRRRARPRSVVSFSGARCVRARGREPR